MLVQDIGFASASVICSHDHLASGYHEFHYFLDGEGHFDNGGNRYRFQPGSLFYSRPGDRHEGTVSQPGSRYQMYYILFSPDPSSFALVDTLPQLFLAGAPRQVGRGLGNEFEDIRRRTASANPLVKQSADYRFLALLCDLETKQPMPRGGPVMRYVAEAQSLMQSSIHTGLDLDVLSRKLGIDKSYFIRLFKQAVGQPPMRYFLGLRLDIARYRVANSQESLRSIARDLGFHDEFHFSRQFKTHVGQSPQAFRRSGGLGVAASQLSAI